VGTFIVLEKFIGYFSRENIKYMDKCGYDFAIMVKGMKALVSDAIKEVQGGCGCNAYIFLLSCATNQEIFLICGT